jgi:hypothetical protein
MPNAQAMVGNAPTISSTKDERNTAEKFGYLIDRGNHVEWHQDDWMSRWRLPDHPPAGLPTLRSVRISTGELPDRLKKPDRSGQSHTPGYAADGPPVHTAGPSGRNPFARTGKVLLYVVFGVFILAFLALVAIFGDGSGHNNGLSWGRAMGGPMRMWLSDDDDVLLAATGSCSLKQAPKYFPEEQLALLRAHGVRIDNRSAR